MGFISICKALYDYEPQDEGELLIREGDLVYILNKDTAEPNWWKAKTKAANEEEEEPVGLIPDNYVEEIKPTQQAKALYDYARQTDEEISFSEDAVLSIYDTSDPDWTLVGFNGEYGFAPANYIETTGNLEEEEIPAPSLPTRPSHVAEPQEEPPAPSLPIRPAQAPQIKQSPESSPPESPPRNPAANLASIISRQVPGAAPKPTKTVQFTPEVSEDEGPPPGLPQRPTSQQIEQTPVRSPSPARIPSPPLPPLPPLPTSQSQSSSPSIPRITSPDHSGVVESPPENRTARSHSNADGLPSPGGYHLYNINEMVSIMGKQKKMPTTLGINLGTGVILIIPEKKRDGPQQEWTAEKLTHYSIEGKHVFMELVKPSRSIDFHAGAKDTATEIVSGLGELAGMARAEGLREVFSASRGQGQRKGHMVYEFMAQGDDEVTVAEGDAVIILDDTQSEEWWKVRRVKNGKEGVVPSTYVEIDGPASPPPVSSSGINAGKSTVEQNRLEEERLARDAIQPAHRREEKDRMGPEVGPGLKLPNRNSSLVAKNDNHATSSHRSKRDSRSEKSRSKPDMTKIRTWTDRSGSFKVEAQFIGLKDSKIHLHKLNGVKIAVPVAKMATEDLEYVENATGVSLDEDKPVSDIIKRSQSQKKANGQQPKSQSTAGAHIEKKPEYDWFDFFLKCGVGVHQCERYSYNFNKDSMDASVLEEITPEVLRNLGLKEGDVLRVMKYLDTKYVRTGSKAKARNVSFAGEEAASNEEKENGGLFSGPGGTLKNNTRKGRPAPPVQTSDIVDSKVFKQKSSSPELDKDTPESPEAPKPPAKDKKGGFDDDAWDVKPAKQPTKAKEPVRSVSTPPPSSATSAPEPAPPKPVLTGAMRDLSLLDEPLQPVVTHSGASQQSSQPQVQQQVTPQITQPQSQPQPQSLQTQTQAFPQPQQQPSQPQQALGATPALFSQLGPQPTGMPQQTINPQLSQIMSQQTGQFGTVPRQRPQAPPIMQQQGSILPPPPTRPLSAPQNQQSSFAPPPIQPQLTGYQTTPNQNFNQMTSPTQTLNDLQRMRLQAQMSPPQQQLSQFTGFPGQNQQFGMQPNGIQQNNFAQSQIPGLQPQMTGIPQNPYIMGQQAGSPFADPRIQQQQSLQPQITGFQPTMTPQPFFQPMAPQATGSMNSVFSPPLQIQNTGINGMNNLQNRPAFGQAPPPVPHIPQQFGGQPGIAPQQQIPSPPPIPQQPTIAPLQPQKTGPAPPVKFGMQPEVKKLAPQPTGRRANLSHATPDNPFGFGV